MTSEPRLSPRQEALDVILATSNETPGASIGSASWEKLVSLAWDNRSQVGDRREIQRQVRSILLDGSREAGIRDAAE